MKSAKSSDLIIDPFSFLWWNGIVFSLFIGVIIIQLAIRIPPDKRKILRLAIGSFMFFEEIWNQWYIFQLDLWSLSSALPIILLCNVSPSLSTD